LNAAARYCIPQTASVLPNALQSFPLWRICIFPQ
jgi:hypothetical protein